MDCGGSHAGLALDVKAGLSAMGRVGHRFGCGCFDGASVESPCPPVSRCGTCHDPDSKEERNCTPGYKHGCVDHDWALRGRDLGRVAVRMVEFGVHRAALRHVVAVAPSCRIQMHLRMETMGWHLRPWWNLRCDERMGTGHRPRLACRLVGLGTSLVPAAQPRTRGRMPGMPSAFDGFFTHVACRGFASES